MQTRELGPFKVSAIGLGCMNISMGYGPANDPDSERLLTEALDTGAWSGDGGLTVVEFAPYGVIGSLIPSTNPVRIELLVSRLFLISPSRLTTMPGYRCCSPARKRSRVSLMTSPVFAISASMSR